MTVDRRIRHDEEQPPVEPAAFFGSELPAAFDAGAALVGPGLAWISPRPATFEVDGQSWTLGLDDDRVVVSEGTRADAAYVRLSVEQLTDLVHDQATFMSMWAANTLDQSAGTVGHLYNWWLALRAVLDGTPIYVPGAISFVDDEGAPLDLTRSFRVDDDPDAMRTFVEQAGFLHLQGVFGVDEMDAISADMDRAAPTYREGDGRSWWARTAEGDTRVVRMQGFDRESDTTAALLDDARLVGLADIPGAGHRNGVKRVNNRIEALFKPIGVTEGISDIPWHKDCGLGRHSYECCGMTVGISVTGADETSGQLRVLAGSHRALVWSGVRQPHLDLPDIPLPTATGDVTIHMSCTMHMAQPPVERERRVLYTGFSLPPLHSVDAAAMAQARARLGAVRETAPLTVLDRHFKS
jgi:hypothetical protein